MFTKLNKIYVTGIKFFLVGGLIFSSTAGLAGKYKDLPKGCRDAGYEYKHKMLHLLPEVAGKSDSIYFVHNHSGRSINLYQTRPLDSEYGVNNNNRIAANEWAVYSSDKNKAKFICTVPNSAYPYGEIVDCKNRLTICEYTNVKYGLNNKGNYWLADSTTKNTAIRKTVRHGILLR